MTSVFDSQTFLDATTTEANSRRPPLPAGRDFIGIIGDLKEPRQVQGKKDPTQTYTFLELPIKIDLTATPDVHTAIGVDSVVLNHSIRIDLTESGSLDNSPGKNGGLRQLREALGLNVPGQSFSMRMMVGRPVRVKIKHETYEGEIFDRTDGVAKV